MYSSSNAHLHILVILPATSSRHNLSAIILDDEDKDKLFIKQRQKQRDLEKQTKRQTDTQNRDRQRAKTRIHVLGLSEITENLYCNCVHLYWEGWMICSIYLR